SGQAFADHFKDVAGQLARGTNALQLPLHQRLARNIVLAPASQRRQLPRSNLRIERIQLNHQIRQEAITRTVSRMEIDQVLPGKRPNQRTNLVRVLDVERRMLHQRLDPLQTTRQTATGLDTEPLVHDQRVVLEVFSEGCQGLGLLFNEWRVDQYRQCGQALGHVVASVELLEGRSQNFRFVAEHQVRQRDFLQAATGGVLGL